MNLKFGWNRRSFLAALGAAGGALFGPAKVSAASIFGKKAKTSAQTVDGEAIVPITTGLGLPGAVIERDLGLAFGLVVRSMGFAKSFGAGLTSLRQGEVPQYTRLLEDSRRHAIDRMVENARLLGANAIVAMRFDSSEISQQLTEIVAYGTAVVVRSAG